MLVSITAGSSTDASTLLVAAMLPILNNLSNIQPQVRIPVTPESQSLPSTLETPRKPSSGNNAATPKGCATYIASAKMNMACDCGRLPIRGQWNLPGLGAACHGAMICSLAAGHLQCLSRVRIPTASLPSWLVMGTWTEEIQYQEMTR